MLWNKKHRHGYSPNRLWEHLPPDCLIGIASASMDRRDSEYFERFMHSNENGLWRQHSQANWQPFNIHGNVPTGRKSLIIRGLDVDSKGTALIFAYLSPLMDIHFHLLAKLVPDRSDGHRHPAGGQRTVRFRTEAPRSSVGKVPWRQGVPTAKKGTKAEDNLRTTRAQPQPIPHSRKY